MQTENLIQIYQEEIKDLIKKSNHISREKIGNTIILKFDLVEND